MGHHVNHHDNQQMWTTHDPAAPAYDLAAPRCSLQKKIHEELIFFIIFLMFFFFTSALKNC